MKIEIHTSNAITTGSMFATIKSVHFESSDASVSVLSVSQFADAAGVTPQAVRKMISEGRLKAAKVGEQHVIAKAELNEYLATS